jgi:disulfide bond formation protein DsbB
MDDTYILRRERRRMIVLAVVAIALLGGALYLQFFRQEAPCPLCILQRYAYLFIAVFALIGAVFKSWRKIWIAQGLILLAALGGIAAAGWHVWTQISPSFSCGVDTLRSIVDSLPFAKLLPQVFQVQGLCETPYPPLLGLSLPQWSLLGFVIVFVLVSLSLRQCRKRQHRSGNR